MTPVAVLRTFLGRPAGIVILSTVGVALLALIDGLLYVPTFAILLKVVAVFALLGAFPGTILATDSRSGLAVADRPLLRTVVCAAIGGTVACTYGFSAPFALLSAGVAGALGRLGMTWARYVDF